MASLTDVLSVVQNGVVAFSNLGKQMAGSLLNISGQLTTNSSAIAAANVNIAALQALVTPLVPAPKLTTSLSSDVAISNSVYSDGPTLTQGSSGTWLVMGGIVYTDSSGSIQLRAKLWDGTTVIDSRDISNQPPVGTGLVAMSFSGVITSPSSNIRISCLSNSAGATTTFKFNASGNSKDCTLTAIRIG
jgi:hypothetical protein